MKHFKKIESKFLFSLLIMSVWSIIAVGQTTAKISTAMMLHTLIISNENRNFDSIFLKCFIRI